MTEYTFHPAAGLFPLMGEEELAELANDIKANSLREPICVHDGRIVDGRNRYLACKRAGIEPRFKVYPGGDDGILAFVISHNLHRRHLTTDQRAAIAAELAKLPAHRPSATITPPNGGLSTAKAAERFDVSERSVERAKAVMREAPDLHAKVKAGELTAGDARREAESRRAPEQLVEQEQVGEQESEEEEEIDHTKFILEHVAAAYELVNYYRGWKPQEIAGLIDPARRNAALVKKTKRLENWFHDLGYWLEQGR
jgi:ParB-like chromosome segregation protein Spo0J